MYKDDRMESLDRFFKLNAEELSKLLTYWEVDDKTDISLEMVESYFNYDLKIEDYIKDDSLEVKGIKAGVTSMGIKTEEIIVKKSSRYDAKVAGHNVMKC